MQKELIPVSIVLAIVAACAAAPGTRPHDMSEAQHEAMARSEDKQAEVHLAQYDPDASVKTLRCGSGSMRVVGAEVSGCRIWRENPTKEELTHAKEHRKVAAAHRAGSQALADAEARACAGLSEEDRDTSPFDHASDIASVTPLESKPIVGKAKVEGATVTFRSLDGGSAEWLQRVVDCHLARNTALGNNVPEMPNCPLVLKNITARVSGTEAGFSVAIRSDDPQTAQEVLRRANALAKSP
jgi:hypothetical protein